MPDLVTSRRHLMRSGLAVASLVLATSCGLVPRPNRRPVAHIGILSQGPDDPGLHNSSVVDCTPSAMSP
jgi:hypothetical protein